VTDCIFCKIATGEIPADFVYEDAHVVAIDDLSPQAPVHTLIIPRVHLASLADGIDDETRSALLRAVPEVARAKGILETGYRVIVNNGPDANQTVGHLHVHVIGGRAMAHGMVNFTAL
jgi:histidine triad (HIT) family protein